MAVRVAHAAAHVRRLSSGRGDPLVAEQVLGSGGLLSVVASTLRGDGIARLRAAVAGARAEQQALARGAGRPRTSQSNAGLTPEMLRVRADARVKALEHELATARLYTWGTRLLVAHVALVGAWAAFGDDAAPAAFFSGAKEGGEGK